MTKTRVLLFGTGKYYERYKQYFVGCEILALLDNNTAKQGIVIDGLAILSPTEGIKLDYDAVFILAVDSEAIRRQLLTLGASAKDIYTVHDIAVECKLYDAEEQLGNSETVFLLTDNLSLTGAPIALFMAGRVLKQSGYDVVMVSSLDGTLRREVEKLGIRVYVDKRLNTATLDDIAWLPRGARVIVNTISLYFLLRNIPESVMVLWWVHEAMMFYKNIDREIWTAIKNSPQLKICPVSALAGENFFHFAPKLSLNSFLPYGIAEPKIRDRSRVINDKLNFLFVGFFDYRKAVDNILAAIMMLPTELASKCRVYLVGDYNSPFGENVCELASKIPEVYLEGAVPHENMQSYYDLAEVLLCPSLEDPLPVVAAEAMANSIPCIVSDRTGTADYIRSYENGIICQAGSVMSLNKAISWCIHNRKRLPMLGVEARKIYESHFSLEAFRTSLIELLVR